MSIQEMYNNEGYNNRIHIETEDFKYDYDAQNFDNPVIRSLKNCIIQKLDLFLGQTQIAEVFKNLIGILAEPLKIIDCYCLGSGNVDPSQYFDVLSEINFL